MKNNILLDFLLGAVIIASLAYFYNPTKKIETVAIEHKQAEVVKDTNKEEHKVTVIVENIKNGTRKTTITDDTATLSKRDETIYIYTCIYKYKTITENQTISNVC